MKVRNLINAADDQVQEQPVPDFCLPRNAIGLEYEWEKTKRFPKNDNPYLNLAVNPELPPGAVAPNPLLQGTTHMAVITEVCKYYNHHVDHSLRGEGLEFNFKAPYSGSKLLKAIDAMDDCARVLGFEGSYRTSLHVHLDMRDATFPDDVHQFGAVYCVVEPFLYQYVGGGRHLSNYCIPWYKHPQHFEAFKDCIRKYHVPESSSAVAGFKIGKQANKYAGLNCFSLGDFGTLEFRHGRVTMQRDAIITWINLIMRIKQWCQEHPMTPDKVIDYCNHKKPEQFLVEVFKSHYRDAVRMSRNSEADYWNGLETLYQYVAA